jgi:hypothetical protein
VIENLKGKMEVIQESIGEEDYAKFLEGNYNFNKLMSYKIKKMRE